MPKDLSKYSDEELLAIVNAPEPKQQKQDLSKYSDEELIAAVRGEQGSGDGVMDGYEPEFHAESLWGEQQVVSSFDPKVGEVIDKALAKVGKRGKKSVSTPSSDEMDDTGTGSPLKPFKGYKR